MLLIKLFSIVNGGVWLQEFFGKKELFGGVLAVLTSQNS